MDTLRKYIVMSLWPILLTISVYGQKETSTINIHQSKNPVIVNNPKGKVEINNITQVGNTVIGRLVSKKQSLNLAKVDLYDEAGWLKSVTTDKKGAFYLDSIGSSNYYLIINTKDRVDLPLFIPFEVIGANEYINLPINIDEVVTLSFLVAGDHNIKVLIDGRVVHKQVGNTICVSPFQNNVGSVSLIFPDSTRLPLSEYNYKLLKGIHSFNVYETSFDGIFYNACDSMKIGKKIQDVKLDLNDDLVVFYKDCKFLKFDISISSVDEIIDHTNLILDLKALITGYKDETVTFKMSIHDPTGSSPVDSYLTKKTISENLDNDLRISLKTTPGAIKAKQLYRLNLEAVDNSGRTIQSFSNILIYLGGTEGELLKIYSLSNNYLDYLDYIDQSIFIDSTMLYQKINYVKSNLETDDFINFIYDLQDYYIRSNQITKSIKITDILMREKLINIQKGISMLIGQYMLLNDFENVYFYYMKGFMNIKDSISIVDQNLLRSQAATFAFMANKLETAKYLANENISNLGFDTKASALLFIIHWVEGDRKSIKNIKKIIKEKSPAEKEGFKNQVQVYCDLFSSYLDVSLKNSLIIDLSKIR